MKGESDPCLRSSSLVLLTEKSWTVPRVHLMLGVDMDMDLDLTPRGSAATASDCCEPSSSRRPERPCLLLRRTQDRLRGCGSRAVGRTVFRLVMVMVTNCQSECLVVLKTGVPLRTNSCWGAKYLEVTFSCVHSLLNTLGNSSEERP